MRFRTLALVFALACGTAMAAAKHPKPLKAAKHTAPKVAKHAGSWAKPLKHTAQKPVKHSARKPVKHKVAKLKKR